MPLVVFNRCTMRGFGSSVLSCQERERLEEELFEARDPQGEKARKRDSAKVNGVVNSTLRNVPENGSGAFPGAYQARCMKFLLSSTEV
jgi:hypothetical protein